MLKIILFAYSKSIHTSRHIEAACRENVVFMALAANTQPHFTTIANFISSMKDQIVPLFRDVLTLCYSQGLISQEMFDKKRVFLQARWAQYINASKDCRSTSHPWRENNRLKAGKII